MVERRERHAVHEGVDSVWLAGQGAYEPSQPLGGVLTADVAIVGGGFTGVSTAYHLSKRFPDKRILILEAHELASGASGRNGGLVLTGLPGLHPHDLEGYRRHYEISREGIDLIESIIKENNLPVPFRREGCLKVFTNQKRADLAAAQTEERRAVGLPEEFLHGKSLARWIEMEGVAGAVLDPSAGQLNGARLVRSLRPILEQRGVTIHEGTPVISILEGSTIRLETPSGEVRAQAIVLATNAYTPRLGYFKNRLIPVHSHVLATEPLSEEEWGEIGWHRGCGFTDDSSRLAYASMTSNGQLVFGGGSNASYDYLFGSRARFSGRNDRAVNAVYKRLARYFPRAGLIGIHHRWSGALGMTLHRMPTIGVRGEHRNVYYALGYSGFGVMMSNLAGKILCDIYSGADERWRELPFYCREPSFIPPEPARWVGYKLFTALTGKSPRRWHQSVRFKNRSC
jgi:glycine/D-amino acid oxidase-like deaminating enzyme